MSPQKMKQAKRDDIEWMISHLGAARERVLTVANYLRLALMREANRSAKKKGGTP